MVFHYNFVSDHKIVVSNSLSVQILATDYVYPAYSEGYAVITRCWTKPSVTLDRFCKLLVINRMIKLKLIRYNAYIISDMRKINYW